MACKIESQVVRGVLVTMAYNMESQVVRRRSAEIDRLRARAVRVARRMVLNDAGAVELLNSCLLLCESLLRDLSAEIVSSEGLARQATGLERWWLEVLDEMPLACLEVSDAGEIVRANRAAAVLLNTSAMHLRRRHLRPFVVDRERFAGFLQDVSFEPSVTHLTSFRIRPRERAGIEVKVTAISRRNADPATALWFLERDGAGTRPTLRTTIRNAAAPVGVDAQDGVTAASLDEPL